MFGLGIASNSLVWGECYIPFKVMFYVSYLGFFVLVMRCCNQLSSLSPSIMSVSNCSMSSQTFIFDGFWWYFSTMIRGCGVLLTIRVWRSRSFKGWYRLLCENLKKVSCLFTEHVMFRKGGYNVPPVVLLSGCAQISDTGQMGENLWFGISL